MAKDAPLDMRMDESAALTAEEVVNTYSVEDLTRIFKEYGEERFAFQIAKNIERARAHKTIQKSGELTEIIESSIPWKFRQNGPCQRKVFQAIRIEVNGELEGLKECVIGLTRRLKKGGRIAVLTFHSLEDRITKTAFRELAASCNCPPSFPVCVCGKKSEIRIITGKPLVASEEEQGENSRSKCAKLRVAERILD
jgi:16S rRNA (cytosine1402-N4)-methyltransferase